MRYVVTARRPPPPQDVQLWLRQLCQAHEAQRGKPAAAANFGMDPNTGSLLLVDPASQDTGGSAGDSDLLGTPAFASPALGPAVTRLRGRSRLASASQGTPVQPESEVGPCSVHCCTDARGGLSLVFQVLPLAQRIG